MNSISIVEWFKPEKLDHLKAYNHLYHKGFWPKDFIPKEVIITNLWQVSIANKIAMHYVRERMDNENL
jgi:hypothetical protein